MNSLSGKVALVSGGRRGIGAAIARNFAVHGADVVIIYSTSKVKADAALKGFVHLDAVLKLSLPI